MEIILYTLIFIKIIPKVFFVVKVYISKNSELLIALSALTVSLCALIVSIKESRHRRKHDRLSVRPWLQIQLNISEYKGSGLFVVNNGIGPAIITAYSIYYNNELIKVNPHKSPWRAIIKKYNFPNGRYRDNRLPTPYWLPARETIDLFVFDDLKKNVNENDTERDIRIKNINLFIEKINSIRVEIKYQSCYAEKRKSKKRQFKEYFYTEYNGAGKERPDFDE